MIIVPVTNAISERSFLTLKRVGASILYTIDSTRNHLHINIYNEELEIDIKLITTSLFKRRSPVVPVDSCVFFVSFIVPSGHLPAQS